MTEKEYINGLHSILPSYDDQTTRRWLDAHLYRKEQLHYALYAFSFVGSNFEKRILDSVYYMEPIPIIYIPEVALRLNTGSTSDDIYKAWKSGWNFRLGFVPSASIMYRSLGLYTLVAGGREIHYYSPFCHFHGLDNPFEGLEEYAHNVGKSLADAFYAVQDNPALTNWFSDELPRGTIIFRRTFDEQVKLLMENLRTSTAIGPVYRQDYDRPENSYVLVDHIR